MKERLSGGSYLRLRRLLYRSTTNNNVTSEQNINTAAAEPQKSGRLASLWKPGGHNGGVQTRAPSPHEDDGQVFFYYSDLRVACSGRTTSTSAYLDAPVALEAPIVAQPRARTWVSVGPCCYRRRCCGARQGCGGNLGARRHFSVRGKVAANTIDE